MHRLRAFCIGIPVRLGDEALISHQSLTYLRHPSDHVVNETSDSAKAGDMLAPTLPDGQGNFALVLCSLDNPDVHVDMANVFGERSSGASDLDDTRLYLHSHTLGNVEFFGLEDVAHLGR